MSDKISVAGLRGVPETLLITLYNRAVETTRPDAIIHDEQAVAMIDAIDYDFSRYDAAWTTQVNTAVRTEIFDQVTSAFITAHPDALIVNLGAGLDTRFFRVDNGQIRWYELDMPASIETRRRFFQEAERYSYIPKSLLDLSWMDAVEPRPYVLLLAEGVLPYCEQSEVRSFLIAVADRFRGAEIVFDTVSPFAAKRGAGHVSIAKTDTVTSGDASGSLLKWGTTGAAEFVAWDPRFRVLNQWSTLDRHKRRWRELRYLSIIPAFKRGISGPIVHLRLG